MMGVLFFLFDELVISFKLVFYGRNFLDEILKCLRDDFFILKNIFQKIDFDIFLKTFLEKKVKFLKLPHVLVFVFFVY